MPTPSPSRPLRSVIAARQAEHDAHARETRPADTHAATGTRPATVGRNAFPGFSFDGRGINGRDSFRSRLATLTEAGHAERIGPVLAAAPELLDLIRALMGNRRQLDGEAAFLVLPECEARANALLARLAANPPTY